MEIKISVVAFITLSHNIYNNIQVSVYYGTETGTSRRYAEDLGNVLKAKYDVKVSSISDCSVNLLMKIKSTHLVFLIASTFGNGDPPTEAKEFASYLKKHLALGSNRQDLENLK